MAYEDYNHFTEFGQYKKNGVDTRLINIPLDETDVFLTLEDALKYAKGVITPVDNITDWDDRYLAKTAYPGQIIAVRTSPINPDQTTLSIDSNQPGTYKVYQIQGDGTLELVNTPQGQTGPQGPKGDPGGATGVTGPTGAQGQTGERGIQGQTGERGITGAQGLRGATGPAGYRGTTGAAGITGAVGDMGPAGYRGETGPAGYRGETGIQGITGVQGITGYQGQRGQTGYPGVTGATGLQGLQGITGKVGATGARGITGPQGLQGTTGPAVQGRTGEQGPRGITGPQGLHGAQGITGPMGAEGDRGPRGETGPSGYRGETGIQGITGVQGAAGITGARGFTGPGGIQGITGAYGIRGITGVQGAAGITGARGYQGITGAKGPQGVTGNRGPQGYMGPTGPTGPTGLKGQTGDRGPIGYQGITGIQGIRGLTGAKGPQGDPGGATGLKGPTGDRGPIGYQGITGLRGQTGPIGITGNRGPAGYQGITGRQGTTGNRGPAGYQGITGAKGPQGDPGGVTGIQGRTGVQGVTGIQGRTGVQGVTGIQGRTGPAGASYTAGANIDITDKIISAKGYTYDENTGDVLVNGDVIGKYKIDDQEFDVHLSDIYYTMPVVNNATNNNIPLLFQDGTLFDSGYKIGNNWFTTVVNYIQWKFVSGNDWLPYVYTDVVELTEDVLKNTALRSKPTRESGLKNNITGYDSVTKQITTYDGTIYEYDQIITIKNVATEAGVINYINNNCIKNTFANIIVRTDEGAVIVSATGEDGFSIKAGQNMSIITDVDNKIITLSSIATANKMGNYSLEATDSFNWFIEQYEDYAGEVRTYTSLLADGSSFSLFLPNDTTGQTSLFNDEQYLLLKNNGATDMTLTISSDISCIIKDNTTTFTLGAGKYMEFSAKYTDNMFIITYTTF